MTITAQLKTVLATVGTVTPNVAKDSAAPPYVTYFRLSAVPENTLAAGGGVGLTNTRFQVDIWALGYEEAQGIEAAIRTALLGWAVQNVTTSAAEQYETDTKLHHIILEVSTWHL